MMKKGPFLILGGLLAIYQTLCKRANLYKGMFWKLLVILHDKVFLENNLADILDEVRMKMTQILCSRRWHFITATSSIL